jgi:hypothetical protein
MTFQVNLDKFLQECESSTSMICVKNLASVGRVC